MSKRQSTNETKILQKLKKKKEKKASKIPVQDREVNLVSSSTYISIG